jgi:hypothetical protein
MERAFPGIFGWSNYIAHVRLNSLLPKYILVANDHVVIMYKTRFIHLGLNHTQYSNTPAP